MTMSDAGADTTRMSEADEQAFFLRIDQLYGVYENWTGTTDDVEEKPAAERRQSSGELCIQPVEAFTTFAVFTARLGVDFGMSRDEFLEALGAMYDNEEEGDGDDGDDDGDDDAAPRGEPS